MADSVPIDFSIILPVHNQADHIGPVVQGYLGALAHLNSTYEILLIENGSSDRSLEVCTALASGNPAVKAHHLSQGGWGNAVRAGISLASGNFVCYTNSARTTPAHLLYLLAGAMTNPGFVVKANRQLRYPVFRRIGSVLYNLECRFLLGLSSWDVNGTPKILPRDFCRRLALREGGDLIDLELITQCTELGLPILEVPINSAERHGGESTTSVTSALKMYAGAIKMWRAGKARKRSKPAARAVPAPEAPSFDAVTAHWKASLEYRNPHELLAFWKQLPDIHQELLTHYTEGDWWGTLARLNLRLIITREYEHLAISLATDKNGRPDMSVLRVPHPSGVAVDHANKTLFIASTRNPNMIYEFKPTVGLLAREDQADAHLIPQTLMPIRATFFPGCYYFHDLAMIGGELYANSVGQNSVVRIAKDGSAGHAWWPKCIERAGEGPVHSLNYIQLNSIGAGATLEDSYFSASGETLGELRPGHPEFPVDRRGVVFSGKTREPVARGLTRPHSVRQHNGAVYVADSGYGRLCRINPDRVETVAMLPGWTRGLGIHSGVAFVGSSRVIPQFSQYAPGLDPRTSRCGIHAVELATGKILGSLYWPQGNQIFAVECVSAATFGGWPFSIDGAGRISQDEKALFYSYRI